MLKKIILLGIGFMPLLLDAQVTISAQLPPGGFVQKDQLWNLILVNNKDDIRDVNIRMNLQDAISGQVVLSANTGNILLGKGVKVITSRDVQPIMYNYNAPDLNKNYLPMGAYIACYQVYSAIQKEDPLGDECIRINIDPLSPPLLNSPPDKSELQSPYPQFTWMPPSPYDMFTNLSYDIVVAEVLPGQSSSEAIEFNTPVYSKGNIYQTNDNYPASFTRLDPDKTYAWQVVAQNGQSYAAKTEIWTFKIKKDSIARIISLAPFIKLNQSATEISVAHQGYLKMEVVNNLTDSVGRFIVRNMSSSNKQSIVFEMKIPIKTGQNFLEYDMNKHGKLNKNDVYQVEYINSINQSYFMKFMPVYYH